MQTNASDPLLGDMPAEISREIAGMRLDIVRAGAARIKRAIFPPGFRWSTHMKPVAGTELCMHAHAAFLARGEVHFEFADGCVRHYRAPQPIVVEPGHDAWVVGEEPAVLIEFDFERDTLERLGLPPEHRHA
jgi:hypothetical protein